ncbi:MAG: helix-turn-helix domain-containing protein [Eubacteriales bacterium]
MEKYYSVEEASKIIGLHPKTIARYIREGKLAANKVGKGWRISGHDLSVFVEGQEKREKSEKTEGPIRVSAVVDIPETGRDAAMRIANTLTAISNSKDKSVGTSSLTTQYIESERQLRIMLWGSVRYIEVMMGALSSLTETDEIGEYV